MGAQPWNRLRCTSSSSLTSVQCICASSRRLWPPCWRPTAHWSLHPTIVIWPLGTNLSFLTDVTNIGSYILQIMGDLQSSDLSWDQVTFLTFMLQLSWLINKGWRCYGPVCVSLITSYRFKGHLAANNLWRGIIWGWWCLASFTSRSGLALLRITITWSELASSPLLR